MEREFCEKERNAEIVICLQRENAPKSPRHRSTEVVEERKMIDELRVGRTGDIMAARHLM